jgi:hypothetical protein
MISNFKDSKFQISRINNLWNPWNLKFGILEFRSPKSVLQAFQNHPLPCPSCPQ